MKTMELRVKNSVGLHEGHVVNALSTKASMFKSSIELEYEGSKIDVKSVLGLLSLGIPEGSFIKFYIDGIDEDKALTAMKNELRDSGFVE